MPKEHIILTIHFLQNLPSPQDCTKSNCLIVALIIAFLHCWPSANLSSQILQIFFIMTHCKTQQIYQRGKMAKKVGWRALIAPRFHPYIVLQVWFMANKFLIVALQKQWKTMKPKLPEIALRLLYCLVTWPKPQQQHWKKGIQMKPGKVFFGKAHLIWQQGDEGIETRSLKF